MLASIAKINLLDLKVDPTPNHYNVAKNGRLIYVTTLSQRVIRWIKNIFGGVNKRVKNAFNESVKMLYPQGGTEWVPDLTLKSVSHRKIQMALCSVSIKHIKEIFKNNHNV